MASNNPADSTGSIPRAYLPEDVIYQSLIAFGQATDYLRVNRDAAHAIVNLMKEAIEQQRVQLRWETEAVQILERLRAIGRSAALLAIQDGRTVIGAADVENATSRVILASKTRCPEGSGSPGMSASYPSSL
jgi:histone H3/H4